MPHRAVWFPPLIASVAVTSVAMLSGMAAAQDANLRGAATARYALETGTGDSQVGELLFEPELTGDLNPSVSFTLLGRMRFDLIDELEPGIPGAVTDSRSQWNRRAFLGDRADLELREAYADIYAGDWFFRLGKQQVVWGQSDGLRVLDQINPLSFREFILGDFEDRRIPLWMVNAERPIGPLTAQFLWIPDTTYNEMPEAGRFAFTSPAYVPSIPDDAASVSVREADRPDRLIEDSDVGLRLTGFMGGWDFSVNALYAYLDSPIVRRRTNAAKTYVLSPEYESSTLVGGSASNAFGKFTLRTELGYQTNVFVQSDSPSAPEGVSKTSELSGVVGLDYQLDGDIFFSGQIFTGYLMDDVPLARRDRNAMTFSMLASKEFRNDQIKLEFLWLHDARKRDGLIQLSARYHLSSDVTLRAGADVFYGDQEGFYGQFDQRDRITLSIEHGF